MRGQRTVGKGGIIGQLSVQRCARQTKDENEPSKEMVAGQFAGPSIEHRTSLIFSLNLAHGLNGGYQTHSCNPSNRTSSTGPASSDSERLHVQRHSRLGPLSVRHLPPDPPSTPNRADGSSPVSAQYTNIRPTTSATQHTRHQTCALRELRMKETGRLGRLIRFTKTLRLNLRDCLGRVDQELRP